MMKTSTDRLPLMKRTKKHLQNFPFKKDLSSFILFQKRLLQIGVDVIFVTIVTT